MNKQSILFSKLNYLTCTLLLISAVLGVNALSSANKSRADQGKAEDKVIKHMQYPNQPVEINIVKVKGKAVKLNEKIDENADDWLENLSITVKNLSPKTITYMVINIDFPETESTGNMMTFPLRYGQNSQLPMITGQPEILLPDQTATLTLSGQTFTRLKTFIEKRQELKNLKKVTLHLNQVSFEDGTLWSAGSFFPPRSQ